jgi:ABC-type polar amino acid transport system ATPase subunit
VCLLGPSGGGKTTLLRSLNLLELPDAGTIQFKGETIGSWPGFNASKSDVRLRQYRARVGMVFQQFDLFPNMTALRNISLGPRRVLGLSQEEAEARAMQLLGKVGMSSFATFHPHQLSGGQQQRVAIARALAMQPDIILFDEPTSALDPDLRDEVLSVMQQLATDGMTMIIVTHELPFAHAVADRIVILEKGRIIEDKLRSESGRIGAASSFIRSATNAAR